MDNEKALSYRQLLPKLNHFNIKELYNMPKYFGWVDYYTTLENKIFMFLGGNDDGVALRCFWNNHYERKTLEIWSKVTSVDGIVLDIGAHSGIYSLVANKSIKSGAVLSFEPHFLNFSRLNLNLRANEFSTKTAFMYGVGKNNETLPFSISPNLDYLTSGGKIGRFQKQITSDIQTIAIDKFLDSKAKNNVKVIKLDVEGYEYECLQGMLETIINSKPLIFFECMSSKNNNEIELFLKNQNYEIFIINDLNGFIEKTNKIYPIFDENKIIIHETINRIAVPKSKLKSILEILK